MIDKREEGFFSPDFFGNVYRAVAESQCRVSTAAPHRKFMDALRRRNAEKLYRRIAVCGFSCGNNRMRRRKGSIAVEATIAFTLSLFLLVTILGTLLSVIVSDISDWQALHTKDTVSVVYGGLEQYPNLNYVSCVAAANADYSRRLGERNLSRNKSVLGEVDDYGFLKLKFEYKPILKGIRESESIVIPAGGIHVSDGVDFTKEIVYITRTGEKYHEGSCFHLRKSKFGIELEEAKSKGYTPCKNCH